MNRKERRAAKKQGQAVNSSESQQRIGPLLQEAVAAHQQGRLEAAAAGYEEILKLDSENPDALHLFGVIHHQVGRGNEAIDLISRAIANGLETELVYNNLGAALRSVGRDAEAIKYYQKAIAIQPGYIDARVNLGNALRACGQENKAIACYRETLNQDPNCADAHSGLALALSDSNAHDEAAKHHRMAAELEPQSPVFQVNLGYLLFEENDLIAAKKSFENAIAIDASYATAQFGLATVLQAMEEGVAAEQAARAGLALDKNEARGWNILGLALRVQRKDDAAEEAFQNAYKIDPTLSDAASNLAGICQTRGDFCRAEYFWNKAIDQWSQSDEKGLAVEEARANRALLFLANGQFAEGWRDNRHRGSIRASQLPFEQESLPDDLTGKKVFLKFDQGLGDEIFFLRFIQNLKVRNPEITYQSQTKIASIIQRNISDIRVITDDQPIEVGDFDHVVSIGDLPHLSNMVTEDDIPASISLSARPNVVAKFTEILKSFGPPPYVGITWRAGNKTRNFLFKDVPQNALAGALSGIEGTFISLQRTPAPGEIDEFSTVLGHPVHDLTTLNDDLEGMLAVLQLLNEYVCVSNTNVHLRAGLGKLCRVLVPFPAEYRWMNRGEFSPWFPDTPVYRQSSDRSWDDAISALSEDFGNAWRTA